MKRYFIVGTDTDCGKTYVTCKLASYLPNTVAIKPIASGCMEMGSQLVSQDALLLQQVSNLPMGKINPWRFKRPVSPHLAAEEEGVYVSADEIAQYCMEWQLPSVEVLLIEGAGGLMVPLNHEQTWIDFLKLTQIPVILVVGMKLGCINHALLTENALRGHGISCAGWIANCLDPDMLCLQENIATLKRKLSFPLLATVDFSGEIASENALLGCY